MQLARRSLGLRYDVMEYGTCFHRFCEVLFAYQYVQKQTYITDAVVEWLYEHSTGNISVVVSLIHDAQEIAILKGTECLDMEVLNEAYTKRLSLLHGYINIKQKKQTSKTRKKERLAGEQTEETQGTISIFDLVATARSEGVDVVQFLKEYIPITEAVV